MRGLAAAPLVAGLLAATLASGISGQASSSSLSFSPPLVIDPNRAGGEPTIFVTRNGHDQVWLLSSHAGLTHYFRSAGVDPGFVTPFRNQTYTWRCTAGSRCAGDASSWQFVDIAGTGVGSAGGQGFSDPDLAEGTTGRLYHTEIDPGVTVDWSTDGGATWTGNPVAVDNGDRPWLAADGPLTAYLSIDPQAFVPQPQYKIHEVFRSDDGGMTFPNHAPDAATLADGSNLQGFGKLMVDPRDHSVVEPLIAFNPQGAEVGIGLGRSVDRGSSFTQTLVAREPIFGFWSTAAIDQAGTIYLVWGGGDHSPDLSAFNATNSAVPDSIRYAYSRDHGASWSRPRDITRPGRSVFWPWPVAGSAGRLGLAWLQSDTLAAVDSTSSRVYVYAAVLEGADSDHPVISLGNASGDPVHVGNVCQEGSGCSLFWSDKDRRLGDYLTTALDPDGHLLVGYGETVTAPGSAVSRPALLHQVGGPSLFVAASGVMGARSTPAALPNTAASIPWTIPVGAGLILLLPLGGLGLARRRSRFN